MLLFFIFLFVCFVYLGFWPCDGACGILVLSSPGQGWNLYHALEARSLKHWSTREVPGAALTLKAQRAACCLILTAPGLTGAVSNRRLAVAHCFILATLGFVSPPHRKMFSFLSGRI